MGTGSVKKRMLQMAVPALVGQGHKERLERISLVMALLRKVILLIPLIFMLPLFFTDNAFAVFLADPLADITAAAVTTFMFFRFFIRMLREGKAAQ